MFWIAATFAMDMKCFKIVKGVREVEQSPWIHFGPLHSLSPDELRYEWTTGDDILIIKRSNMVIEQGTSLVSEISVKSDPQYVDVQPMTISGIGSHRIEKQGTVFSCHWMPGKRFDEIEATRFKGEWSKETLKNLQ